MNETYKDQKAGLVVFGVLQILLGVLCGLLVPMMVLAIVMTPTASPDAPSVTYMVPGLLVYLAGAIWFVWMGIGSTMARRWARALILVTSWIWLVGGVMGFLYMLWFMPGMYEAMGEGGEIPESVATVIHVAMLAFMFVVYILIPGALVLFYGRRSVKATCDARDGRERWTDRCPLPVLAVSVAAAFGGVSMFTVGFYNWALPLFGRILSGAPGAAVVVCMALVLLFVARGTYRLEEAAWWTALVGIVVWSISTVMTFTHIDFMEYYEYMGFPEEQMALMREYPMPSGMAFTLMVAFWGIAMAGYLLYVRRYFQGETQRFGAGS